MKKPVAYRIAALDSGLGGLTVMREMIRQFPENDFIYFGDSGNAPYGDRPPEEIRQLTARIIDFLQAQQVDAIMLACNTITCYCYEDLKKNLDIPVLGPIKSGSADALKNFQTGKASPARVGVMATAGTVNSHSYKKELEAAFQGQVEVVEQPCPSLCPAVEKGTYSHEELLDIVKGDIEGFPLQDLPQVILGCTHFPILRQEIQELAGPDVILIDPARSMAELLIGELTDRQPKNVHPAGQPYFRHYNSSGDLDLMKSMVGQLMEETEEREITFTEKHLG